MTNWIVRQWANCTTLLNLSHSMDVPKYWNQVPIDDLYVLGDSESLWKVYSSFVDKLTPCLHFREAESAPMRMICCPHQPLWNPSRACCPSPQIHLLTLLCGVLCIRGHWAVAEKNWEWSSPPYANYQYMLSVVIGQVRNSQLLETENGSGSEDATSNRSDNACNDIE